MLASPESNAALVNLFHEGTKLRYDKGQFVIYPGEASPGVFYIESGLVKAYDITKYGEENLLVIRKPGEVLGLTWAISGQKRSIIYQALLPTTVWQISQATFTSHLKDTPEAALPLIDMLTEMYRGHSQRILNLEYRSVNERLISFLLNTAERFGVETKDGLLIDVPLKHQDIASSINASRESTGRAIIRLEKRGLLTNSQSRFVLHDIPKLQSQL
ncbi:MAG TPA: Crp/Fnr family transcriptional regulator [Candidatus Binatia bacterium]|nr:Crp/Fnr family transcriptional regulator [Candidatus Binatia bacterium]